MDLRQEKVMNSVMIGTHAKLLIARSSYEMLKKPIWVDICKNFVSLIFHHFFTRSL